MNALLLLIRKEALVELRAQELVVFLGGISLLFALVISIGIESSFLHPSSVLKVYPSLVWLAFLCAATVAVGRAMDYEFRGGALIGLMVGGVSLEAVYLAKVVTLSVILFVVYAGVSVVIGGLLSVPVFDALSPLLLTALPGILSFAALSLIVSAMTEGGRGRSLLLPILLLPLLVPIFAIGMENSHQVFTQHVAVNEVSGYTAAWLMALLYVLLGTALFPKVVRE